MKTRVLPLLASLLVVLASRGWAQTPPTETPVIPSEPAAAVTSPTDSASGDPSVAIKDADATGSATKGRSATGQDTLSVDFPDEDIRNILRNVADLFELNLVIPETLQGKASIKLRDVTWRQIFQVILTPVGYTYIEEGNIITIVSNASMQQEPVTTEVFIVNYARAADIMPTINSLIDTAAGGKIVVDARSNSLVITERPSRMNRIRPIIEQLDRATDQVMIESKFVEVTDGDIRNIGVNWSSLKSYKVGVGPDPENEGGVVGSFNRTAGGQRDAGIQRGNDNTTTTSGGTTGTQTNNSNTTNSVTSSNGVVTATSGTTIGSSLTNTTNSGNSTTANETLNLLNSLTGTTTNERALNAVFTADQFGLVISALNELTTAKVVSNPTVVTLNNTEAFINIGKEYPIPNYTYNEQRGSFEVAGFTYKPIGIILKVTPQVNARGFIKLMIEPEVSSFNDADSVNFGGATGARIPVIQTKKARTQISLKDGFTMGIGGLIDSQVSNGSTKVPVLGSIPVLGRLFSSKTQSTATRNLLIFLTAKTLSAEGAAPGEIFDPRQIRQMDLKKEDLPGYRDGTDPFAPLPSTEKPAEKKHKWFGKK
ncbi:secretin N-terminal domain-containing protein [Opitutus terrae]|uniref:Type II and III secretion system protein n=1 Tax=Opitutus terrae (strain DSM 11246 / JCM 15787 / PB90-1) TaxID=452637 RepID=B1ZTI4_OPITP|nr:secretin N-terminal domain-containing protein [Opitutus terrae]ACB73929.1 type II and III secretion system protein [Opitutus terrae PB90-1]